MGRLSELDADLQTISRVMGEPGQSAEEQIERRMDFVLREMDEFMALASNSETVDLIERERVLMGQILTRAQLIAAFLLSRQPRLTVVSNRHV